MDGPLGVDPDVEQVVCVDAPQVHVAVGRRRRSQVLHLGYIIIIVINLINQLRFEGFVPLPCR